MHIIQWYRSGEIHNWQANNQQSEVVHVSEHAILIDLDNHITNSWQWLTAITQSLKPEHSEMQTRKSLLSGCRLIKTTWEKSAGLNVYTITARSKRSGLLCLCHIHGNSFQGAATAKAGNVRCKWSTTGNYSKTAWHPDIYMHTCMEEAVTYAQILIKDSS